MLGYVTTLHPTPNQVNFELTLPAEGNGRFLFIGNAGLAATEANIHVLRMTDSCYGPMNAQEGKVPQILRESVGHFGERTGAVRLNKTLAQCSQRFNIQ